MRHRLKFVTVLVMVLAIVPPLHAAEITVDAQTCAVYRKGPLVSEQLAIYRQPEVYDWLEIRFRYEYVSQPDLPHDAFGLDPGTPNDTGLFEIEIATGQPRPPVQERYGLRPSEYTHLSLLINGRAYLRNLRSLIGIYAGIPLADLWGDWVNGVPVDKVVPFERTGEQFHGYERISVPGATYHDIDLFIQETADGAITGFLQCNRLGLVPNPGCTLHEQSPHFNMQFRFRRNQMHLIETIRHHARAFTACLTWQNEEK